MADQQHYSWENAVVETYRMGDIEVVLDKKGSDEFLKVSYPLRYGYFSEVKTPEYIFQFNQNGEIKFISGRGKNWPNPSEWLKRTVANDWVYYATGGYSGVYDAIGEYYLPCFSYPSNAIHLIDPFKDKAVFGAFMAWNRLCENISTLSCNTQSDPLKNFLKLIQKRTPQNLKLRSEKFHGILGDAITVLPPDTRHVDYEIIPIIVADGCLYQCGFCKIKSGARFTCRSNENIKQQILSLQTFYDQDLLNYNSIFLGQHDALCAGGERIEFAARQAYHLFELNRSHLKGTHLFLFGSVNSLLFADSALLDTLAALPFYTYINIGLESADQQTLDLLKKAISPKEVEMAFDKMLQINRTYENIEVTANFLFDDTLPENHLPSFFRLMEKKLDHFYPKGAIYFSPLIKGHVEQKQEIKKEFYKIKARSRMPTYLYLIQRL